MLRGCDALLFVETAGPERGRLIPPRRCGAAAKRDSAYCASHDQTRQRQLQELYQGLLHPQWERRLQLWNQMKGPLDSGTR